MENYCATVGELNLNVKLTGETVRIYSFLFFFFPFTVLIHSYRHNYMKRYSSYLIEIGIDLDGSFLSPDLHTCVLPARIVFARNRSFRPINVSSRKRIMCLIPSYLLINYLLDRPVEVRCVLHLGEKETFLRQAWPAKFSRNWLIRCINKTKRLPFLNISRDAGITVLRISTL